MFHIVLYEPQIAPNTGNIIRLAANNGCTLHLIEPLGFGIQEKNLRRAGLDYTDLVDVNIHASYHDFLQQDFLKQHVQKHDVLNPVAGRRIFACTTKGSRPHDQMTYQAGDVFLFGSETAGLPASVLESFSPEYRLRIPMRPSNRSINLSNAVAIVTYEAWRQIGFEGGI